MASREFGNLRKLFQEYEAISNNLEFSQLMLTTESEVDSGSPLTEIDYDEHREVLGSSLDRLIEIEAEVELIINKVS